MILHLQNSCCVLVCSQRSSNLSATKFHIPHDDRRKKWFYFVPALHLACLLAIGKLNQLLQHVNCFPLAWLHIIKDVEGCQNYQQNYPSSTASKLVEKTVLS